MEGMLWTNVETKHEREKPELRKERAPCRNLWKEVRMTEVRQAWTAAGQTAVGQRAWKEASGERGRLP